MGLMLLSAPFSLATVGGGVSSSSHDDAAPSTHAAVEHLVPGTSAARLIRASWFPIAPEVPTDSPDPRKTDKARLTTEADEAYASASAMLKCPSPDGDLYTQVTAYQFMDQPQRTKLIGVQHGFMSERTIRRYEAKDYSQQQISEFQNQVIKSCAILLTDNSGKEITDGRTPEAIKAARIARYKSGTAHPESDPKHDVLLLEIAEPSEYLQPVILRMTSAQELVGQEANIVATHNDIFTTGMGLNGDHRNVFPKIKTTGRFEPMQQRNPLSEVPGMVLHSASTMPRASGSLIFDSQGYGVAIHRGGKNDDDGPYNGFSRYNVAIAVDAEIFGFAKQF
jgi:hypothetical protein